MAVVHKSVLKRARQNLRRRARNQAVRSRIKTESKKVIKAVETGDLEAARSALRVAVPVIARAGRKGIIHHRTASRKISRLTQKVNALEARTAS